MSYTDKQLTEWKQKINAPAVLQSRLKIEQVGNEYVCSCPFHDEKTPSFKIYVNGGTKQWEGTCHGACARSWNLWQIVMKTDNLPFKEAVEKVLTQVGWEEGKEIADQTFTTVLGADKPKVTFPISVLTPAIEALEVSEAGQSWLSNRSITMKTARFMKLGFVQNLSKICPNHPWVDKGWMLIPTIKDGIVTLLQYRSVYAKQEGEITGTRRGPDMSTSMYNLQNMSPVDDLFVTEGGPDVWALHQGGFVATAIPSASYNPTAEELDRMVKANRIYLAGDSDHTGDTAMSKLYERLKERVYRVVWPEGCKDANDFLHKTCGGDTAKFQAGVEDLKMKALATPIGDYYDLSHTLMCADDTPPMDNPLRLHFRSKDVDDMAVLLPGSVAAVYATYTGSGKTTWCLDQFELLEAMEHGRIVLNYSAELSPQEFQTLVTANLLGKDRLTLTDADYKEAGQKLQDAETKFYVGYNPELNRIGLVLDSIEWAIRRFGANLIVLDHLHFLTRGASDEIKAQADAMQRIKNIAVKHKVIFVVVGQSRKAESGRRGRSSEVSDAKGSETFTSDASAVYLIDRKYRRDIDMARPETWPDDALDPVTDIKLLKCRTKGPGKSFARMVFAGSIGQFHSQTSQEPLL